MCRTEPGSRRRFVCFDGVTRAGCESCVSGRRGAGQGAALTDRFVSNFTSRLDAKGRISIPAGFRALLAKDGYDGLYVHRALDLPALDAGGHALRATIDEMLSRFSPFSDEWELLSTVLNGTSEVLKVDPEGRVMLSEALKSHSGIADAATFVGHGHKFQIWEPGRFQAHLEAGRSRLRDIKRALGSPLPGPAA